MSEDIFIKGWLHEQCEKEEAQLADGKNPQPAPGTSQTTGSYSFMLLYMAFFFIPACWMASLPANKEVPQGVAMNGALFGVVFILYGLYKVIRYAEQHDMVDTEAPGFPAFRAFRKLIDKLR